MPVDEKDQERMERQIRAAFRGVSRAGGVSWSEAEVIDGWGTEEACAAARSKDTDRSWEQLVDDPQWEPFTGVGGFSFLDAIGFTYYLAPALVRCVRSGLDEGIRFYLAQPGARGTGTGCLESQLARLDASQRACVAEFIRFMVKRSEEEGWATESALWREALEAGWEDA